MIPRVESTVFEPLSLVDESRVRDQPFVHPFRASLVIGSAKDETNPPPPSPHQASTDETCTQNERIRKRQL